MGSAVGSGIGVAVGGIGVGVAVGSGIGVDVGGTGVNVGVGSGSVVQLMSDSDAITIRRDDIAMFRIMFLMPFFSVNGGFMVVFLPGLSSFF